MCAYRGAKEEVCGSGMRQTARPAVRWVLPRGATFSCALGMTLARVG